MIRVIPLILLLLITYSCKEVKKEDEKNAELVHLKSKLDSLRNIFHKKQDLENDQIATFLTFQDANAEQAMNFYVALFDNSKIISTKRWGKEGPGKEGTIMHAKFNLNGALFMCSDSPAIHEWGFTPAVSNYIECKNEEELQRLFAKLSENGKVMMPLNNYGFSQKFGFVEDQFGVSWQLNLQ